MRAARRVAHQRRAEQLDDPGRLPGANRDARRRLRAENPGGRVPTHVSGRMPETGAWWPFRVLG